MVTSSMFRVAFCVGVLVFAVVWFAFTGCRFLDCSVGLPGYDCLLFGLWLFGTVLSLLLVFVLTLRGVVLLLLFYAVVLLWFGRLFDCAVLVGCWTLVEFAVDWFVL